MQVTEMKGMLENHIQVTKIQIEEQGKLIKSHSEEIWGTGDSNPGIKVKVKELTDSEKEKKVLRTVFASTIIGLVGERVYHLFAK
jgi:ribosomal protein L31E